MKNIPLLLLIVLSHQVYSQASVETAIQSIRSKFQKINAAAALAKPDTIQLEEYSTEGADMLVYKKNGLVIKLIVHAYGETGKSVDEYYMDDKGLIFGYIKKYDYNRPIYWDKQKAKENADDQWYDEKKTKITENRYYFKDEKLIRWIGPDKKQRPTTGKQFADAETEVNEAVYMLMESIDGEGAKPRQ
jgi:hypothetical protein